MLSQAFRDLHHAYKLTCFMSKLTVNRHVADLEKGTPLRPGFPPERTSEQLPGPLNQEASK